MAEIISWDLALILDLFLESIHFENPNKKGRLFQSLQQILHLIVLSRYQNKIIYNLYFSKWTLLAL